MRYKYIFGEPVSEKEKEVKRNTEGRPNRVCIPNIMVLI